MAEFQLLLNKDGRNENDFRSRVFPPTFWLFFPYDRSLPIKGSFAFSSRQQSFEAFGRGWETALWPDCWRLTFSLIGWALKGTFVFIFQDFFIGIFRWKKKRLLSRHFITIRRLGLFNNNNFFLKSYRKKKVCVSVMYIFLFSYLVG